jgi:preprotein translocase subunit SecB
MADGDDKKTKGDGGTAKSGNGAPGFSGNEVPPVTGAPPASDPSAPRMNVLAQYLKDLSFENPNAPESLKQREKPPKVDIRINVQVNRRSESELEVTLKLDANGADQTNNDMLFACELVYAGLFRIANIPENQLGALAMVECPRLLFPFARQILADASRSGGFPPLLLEPVDFVALYRERLRQEAAGTGPALNLSPPVNKA